MSTSYYIKAIRQHLVIITMAILLALSAGLIAFWLTPPSYSSTARVYVSTAFATGIEEFNQANTLSQSVVSGLATVAESPLILDTVARRIGVDSANLSSNVDAQAVPSTSVLNISVTQPSAGRAAEAANLIAARLQDAAAELSPTSTSRDAAIKVTVIASAEPPLVATSPRLLNYLIGSVALGILGGIITALLMSTRRGKVTSYTNVSEEAGSVELARLPHVRGATSMAPLELSERSSAFGEEIRRVRSGLKFITANRPVPKVLVTSSVASEGKTTAVANLGASLAAGGRRVLVLDGDLRRPTLTAAFGLDHGYGLTDLLIGDKSRAECTVALPATSGHLDVIPAGSIAPNPAELLQGAAFGRLMAEIEADYDIILIDSAPLLPVNDTFGMLETVDTVILVAAVGRVRLTELDQTIVRLQTVGRTVDGVLVTFAQDRSSKAYRYSYGGGPAIKHIKSSQTPRIASVGHNSNGEAVEGPTL